jgi:hypothetical protein
MGLTLALRTTTDIERVYSSQLIGSRSFFKVNNTWNQRGENLLELEVHAMMWNNCHRLAPELLRFFIDLICLLTVWSSSLALVKMLIGIHFAKPLDTTKDYHKDEFLTLGKDQSSWSIEMSWIQLTKETIWFLRWDSIVYLSCWRIVKRRKYSREVAWYAAIVEIWITNYNQNDLGKLCRCQAQRMYISRSLD